MSSGGGPAAATALQTTAVLARTIGRDPRLVFRGDRAWVGETPLGRTAVGMRADHLENVTTLRGLADGLGLRLRHSEDEVHRVHRPEEPLAQVVFDLLEQLRVEALVSPSWPGVRRNLRERHRRWVERLDAAGVLEDQRTMLVYCTAALARAHLCADPLTSRDQDRLEDVRGALGPALTPSLLAARRVLADQTAFAAHALVAAAAVQDLEDRLGGGRRESSGGRASARADLRLLLSPDADGAVGATEGGAHSPGDHRQAYSVFTGAHDEVVTIGDLVTRTRLRQHRRTLVEGAGDRPPAPSVHRWAQRARRALLAPQPTAWARDLSTGRLDGARLTRLLVSSTDDRVFRDRTTGDHPGAAVTLLLDCSGSMKQHAAGVVRLVEHCARVLELAGAEVEVLGFTTATWSGGNAQEDWVRAGRPPYPGRLADLRHLVVKDAATSCRRAGPALAGLLESRLYREGVDGEAVEWAARRLLARPASRRLLLVVSDGGPAEAASRRANPEGLLDRHLAAVAGYLEHRVDLVGVEVAGTDLSPYYRRTCRITAAEDALSDDLAALVSALGRERRPAAL